jgi:hypothetical protein
MLRILASGSRLQLTSLLERRVRLRLLCGATPAVP